MLADYSRVSAEEPRAVPPAELMAASRGESAKLTQRLSICFAVAFARFLFDFRADVSCNGAAVLYTMVCFRLGMPHPRLPAKPSSVVSVERCEGRGMKRSPLSCESAGIYVESRRPEEDTASKEHVVVLSL